MNPIIEKLFKRAGVTEMSQLTPDEKITYDQLVNELKERVKPRTPEDWQAFLEEQIEKTIESYRPDDSKDKKDFLWAQLYLIQKLLAFLKGPSREEEKIKKQYNLE